MIGISERRPLTWFLLLILFNILLLSVQVRSANGVILLRVWGQYLSAPLVYSAHFLISSISGFASDYVYLVGVSDENKRLKEENTSLKIELNQLRGLSSLLPKSLDYHQVQQQYRFESQIAAVIGRSAPFLSSRVIVSLGTINGIGIDSAVFVPEGIVGRVVAPGLLSSDVELITNEQAAAGAVVLDAKSLEGIVLGDGSPYLQLEYIPNSEEVAIGSVVVTSGTDRIYPRGLPIGTVVSSKQGPVIYRLIRVAPFVDHRRLNVVLVENRKAGTVEKRLEGPGAKNEVNR
jgi:rod shape-determining protein MreC